MPIYDFQCTSCNHKDELMRKISEETTLICPQCNKETFAKMLSAPSFQLSGSGWYASDFKDKKLRPAQKKINQKQNLLKQRAKLQPKILPVPVTL